MSTVHSNSNGRNDEILFTNEYNLSTYYSGYKSPSAVGFRTGNHGFIRAYEIVRISYLMLCAAPLFDQF